MENCMINFIDCIIKEFISKENDGICILLVFAWFIAYRNCGYG